MTIESNCTGETNYYTEKYRPQFHFTPEKNWMNDPNGMVYYAGEYHLFYQFHPGGLKWGPMHWGHAVSEDMIHWEHLPIAFEPDELGMIFSGSAVVDWNDSSGLFNGEVGLVAIFTHSNEGVQTQSIAYSKDKGRSWEKYNGNPVIHNPGLKDFRDPKVFWHDETNKWIMVLAAGQKVVFYTSPNLINWKYVSDFGLNDGAHGGVWECPDLFKLPVDGDEDNMKWVLQVDIGDGAIAGGSGAQYFIGDFDGENFKNDRAAEDTLWLDFGKDYYAAQSFSDIPKEDGRRIWLAWMSNWKYANEVPTTPWRSAMSVPREVQLKTGKDDKIKLLQNPIDEIKSIRKGKKMFENEIVLPQTNLLSDLKADVFEVLVDFESINAAEVGFKFRKSNTPGMVEETIVGFDVEKKVLFINRDQSGEIDFSEHFKGKHFTPITDYDGKLKLRILVDVSSIEVFINDGENVITDLIFPNTDSKDLELYVREGEAKVASLEFYELNTTWR